MKKMLPLVLLVLPLLLAPASGASAETAAPSADTSALTAGTCPAPVETAVGGPIAPGTCSADCGGVGGGSTSCSGTCTIVDRNCANNQRGYVQCNGGTKVYCAAACPTTTTCYANCTTYTRSIECSGSCASVNQNCSLGIQGYAGCSDGSKAYCFPCSPSGGGGCPNLYCQAGACDDDDDCCGQTGDGYCQPWGQCICP